MNVLRTTVLSVLLCNTVLQCIIYYDKHNGECTYCTTKKKRLYWVKEDKRSSVQACREDFRHERLREVLSHLTKN